MKETEMSSGTSPSAILSNSFTQAPLGLLFVKTALPVIFVMCMNGLLSIIDALFLGIYVGADALAAVTLVFPIYMLIIALSSLVSSGMSSLLARQLGAGRTIQAQTIYASAHGLALLIGTLFILAFLYLGHPVTDMISAGRQDLATMSYDFLKISIYTSPLFFILAVNSDALRNEGLAGYSAILSLLVTLSNILFNYTLIVHFKLGVIGSASGTALAQVLALVLIFILRKTGPVKLRPEALLRNSWIRSWPDMLKLGAPQSLNFFGMSLVSTMIIFSLQKVNSPHYADTISAYGIITRIMTFTFLPLMGLSLSMQSITGNNYGAKLWDRSDNSLRLGLVIAGFYCLATEAILITLSSPIGSIFVSNMIVVSEVSRIMPMILASYIISGPLLILATYFQAIGDARRAAILGLVKPYFFSLPLLFFMPHIWGEQDIWLSNPIADFMLLATAILVLSNAAHYNNRPWGLFAATKKGQ